MKKCIAFLSALAIMSSSCVFSVTADQTLAGDVNDDGAVTSRDIVMLSQYLLGTADYDIAIPDVNNDGDVNILDLISLKKILLKGSVDDTDKDTEITIDKTETGMLDFNYRGDEDDPKVCNTAAYVDSFEKLTDLENSLSEYGVWEGSLTEKFNKEFFDDHSIAFYFSSPLHYCSDVESVTAKDGILRIVASGHESPIPLPIISYTALEFTKEVIDTYQIKSAQYISSEMKSISSSDLQIYASDIVCSEFRKSYKWINSSEELDDFLADPSLYYSSDTAEEITLKYNSEFFKSNRLLVCNDMIDCADASVIYDEIATYVYILSDEQDVETLLFIGMPSEAGENEKTVIKYNYRSRPLKPVIYLYPEEETEVSVSVDLNGKFSCVYPEFTDKENSMWKVTANPDGLLRTDDGSEYNYLFWEGVQDVDWDMSEGFVVKGSDTLSFLRNQLPKMGLTPKEYNDFIVFWLPRMQNNEYNYITFQTDKYTDNAILNVTPDPDSVLRVFMAYTPLNEDEADILRKTVKEPEFDNFERNGFSVVEWGGCKIDK